MQRVRSTVFLLLAAVSAARAILPDWAPPLSTRGRYVVDANGNRFKLKSGNWHGASGTWNGDGDANAEANNHASEASHNLPLGLQYVHIDKILDSFEQIGINSIRLPFSNEMLADTSIVQDDWVAANPQFRGKTPLQVYDAVVQALTDRRFAVILNNHTNKSRWCCGVNDGNERWNSSQDEEKWIQDWVNIVKRYAGNKRVAGADLYNEVRRSILDDPNWGTHWDSHDWYRAADAAGNRILSQGNRDILIIIEGINWYGLPVDGFSHGRPTLTPARLLSHTLLASDKLVYSAHFYGYTGPNHSGATGVGETTDPRYQDFSVTDLYNVYRDQASFVALDTNAHYVHPVWMSEFGVGRLGSADITVNWFKNTVKYFIDNDLDFAYWPLVGYLENGNGNGWALQNWNRAGVRDGLQDASNDWRRDIWASLVNSTSAKTGRVDEVPVWRQLSLNFSDQVKSFALQGNDWDGGARKATCPDGLRLIGVSAGSPANGLCTNAGPPGNRIWSRTEVVYDERYANGDWASGYTKYTCPPGSWAIGYALRGAKVSTLQCASSDNMLGSGTRRTLWMDKGDNRAENLGGDWHNSNYKGQCAQDEHVAGIAFTTSWLRSGTPAAILCRK